MTVVIHSYLQFQDFQLKVEQAVQACQEFSKLYYETVDKKRHVSFLIYLSINRYYGDFSGLQIYVRVR